MFVNIKKIFFSKVSSKTEKDKVLVVYFTRVKSFTRVNGEII